MFLHQNKLLIDKLKRWKVLYWLIRSCDFGFIQNVFNTLNITKDVLYDMITNISYPEPSSDEFGLMNIGIDIF